MTDHEDLRVRLYYGDDDDLLTWYNALPGRGERAQAVREVLRRGLAAGNNTPPALSPAGLPPQLSARLAELPTATEMRALFEAALAEVRLVNEASDDVMAAEEEDTFGDNFLAAMTLQ